MAVVNIELTEEQQQALREGCGFAAGLSYAVMSKETYCRTMGIESEADLRDSLQAIERGLADIAAGRTCPFRDVLDD